ncbi:MAG: tRNA (adenosine(37)-N6)-threonylcarbamoyltransferase complex dimerization subunit type 1 TsaB [Candidatus Methylomirabilis oxygeniifera]|uniref:Peptidase M22, glycoprotease n=1 Tax=Methylomirabilis oxygeniifera TaxID=671143 RepID=D5MFT2_METO1|nr:MAG: tRNA (adenosine(37)-N6)-threonylcarbamoyltransferase complex dimerization subunit type 1 TsaB [Candidatus Methylomirabilis oxyfera]CBE68613.1 Peptidase M22, glycoprotease [Candidatus Methylomirabilis oxyfera]
MLVMGIDTSTLRGGVALVSGQGVVCDYTLNVKATYSERLLPLIDRALQDAGITLPQVEGLAVAVGPGSFTGLRIGLSTAKGLAIAGGQPLVGVSTLEAMAWTLPFCAYQICPTLDARKGELYCALFRCEEDRLIRLTDDTAVAPERLFSQIQEPTVFLGDGLVSYEGLVQSQLKELALFPPLAGCGGRAAAVAELGRRRLLQGHREDLAHLAPKYLRPSEAELRRLDRVVPVTS